MEEESLQCHETTNDGALLGESVIQEALASGTDLQEYSNKLEDKLHQLEHESIKDYISKAEHIAALHGQITSCDGILQEMQGALEGYLSHLSSISRELQSLQEQSTSLHQQLHNTTEAREHLTTTLDALMLPPAVIHHIFNTPVTEAAFTQQLRLLDQKSNFLKEHKFRDAASVCDVEGVVNKLVVRAAARTREYLLQKISQCRKPESNHHVPQGALLKHRFFFEFLLQHARPVAAEVHDEYVETMSKVYHSYFQAYTKQLWRLQYEDCVGRDDLLGAEDARYHASIASASAGMWAGLGTGGGGGGRPPSKARLQTVFSLGNRDAVLSADGLTQDIIVPHVAEREDTKYPLEALFRSEQFGLLDNCCREYAFLQQFFLVSAADALKLFSAVMGSTVQAVQKHVVQVVAGSYDSVGLCVCLHVVHQHRLLCHRRAVPALDNHWAALTAALWTRFEHVVRLNIASVQGCDVKRFPAHDLTPNYMCRRIAELCGGLASLERRYPTDGAEQLLACLHQELESVLLRLAAQRLACDPNRLRHLVFLVNNYDMVLAVLTEKSRPDAATAATSSAAAGAAGGAECERLREVLAARTADCSSELLARDFGAMIAYANKAQRLLDAGDAQGLRQTQDTAVSVAKQFAATWRKAVEQLNNQVMQCFTNFRTGTTVLQRALEMLINAHHALNRALSHPALANTPAPAHLVNTHHLIVEAKKCKPAF